MKSALIAILSICIGMHALNAEAAPKKLSNGQKAKLNSILLGIKKKSKTARPVKYEVTLPVAAAGARGAEAKSDNRFDVIWPKSSITPLVALAENIKADAQKGKSTDALKEQLNAFLKTFPEFKEEQAVKDIQKVLN